MMLPLNFMSIYFGCSIADYKIRFYKTNNNAAWIMLKGPAEIIYAKFTSDLEKWLFFLFFFFA